MQESEKFLKLGKQKKLMEEVVRKNALGLTPYLFWDTNPENIDFEKHARQVIERVVTRGKMEDWFIIQDFYGMDRIAQEVVQIRSMDLKSLHFLAAVLQIPIKNFRCYTEKQSSLEHYPY